MPPARWSVHAILIAVQACFASMAIVGRIALRTVPPDAVVLVRVAGGALVFAAIALASRPRSAAPAAPRARRLDRRDLARLVGCAVCGVVLNQTLFLHGLERTTATNASVLTATIPVFTAGLAVALGVERAVPRRLAGIALALAGTLVLVRADRFSWRDRDALGSLLIVTNALSYALFLVLVRPLAARLRPMALVALLFAIGLPLVSIRGLAPTLAAAPGLTAQALGLLAFLVAVPTVAAYALNQVALGRAEPSLVAVYIYLQPVLVTVTAALLLDERPGLRTAAGAALVFAGVYASGSGTAGEPR